MSDDAGSAEIGVGTTSSAVSRRDANTGVPDFVVPRKTRTAPEWIVEAGLARVETREWVEAGRIFAHFLTNDAGGAHRSRGRAGLARELARACVSRKPESLYTGVADCLRVVTGEAGRKTLYLQVFKGLARVFLEYVAQVAGGAVCDGVDAGLAPRITQTLVVNENLAEEARIARG